ncbi:MFS general substrate transporter [Aspergillus novofumigatus IBT 16806]|uniref:MFS general substrate transporter n=1 Tax=Aspergillus novofumigatus (strain IBT 16806) TaxID=1392255 RepID=A0A2I1C3Q3_ASPN1|nr:MFS general substrate transporter [Aspergillus novofumigatus IBT 16806]PKX92270.1 MFS general substrate transporter [Aspergillus novofumigatus IBT 16806]
MSNRNIIAHHEEVAPIERTNLFSDSESTRILNRQLVRKLDRTLLPILWLMHTLKNLDKGNISQAKLSTFESDLDLHGTQYNTIVSMASVGYIPMMIPSNMLLTRAKPSLYLPSFAVLWSVVATATAASQTFSQAAAMRFLLGLFEAPFTPGALWLLSRWYTKREMALRYAIMYLGYILSGSFAGLIAAGVFSRFEGYQVMGGWRWLFIIEGLLSLIAGMIAFAVLPDTPDASSGPVKWPLNASEREWAVERMRRDRVSYRKSDGSVWLGLRLALLDYRVWMLALVACTQGSTAGYTSFYPEMVKSMHIGDTVVTLLCTVPPYILAAIVTLVVAWLSDQFRSRSVPIAASMTVMIVGIVVEMCTSRSGVRYLASFLYITGCNSAFPLPRAWVATAVSQTPEKCSCAAAILEVITALSYIWSAYFFRNEDAPRYRSGMILLIVFAGACLLSALGMRWVLRRDNRKLLERYRGTGVVPVLHPT